MPSATNGRLIGGQQDWQWRARDSRQQHRHAGDAAVDEAAREEESSDPHRRRENAECDEQAFTASRRMRLDVARREAPDRQRLAVMSADQPGGAAAERPPMPPIRNPSGPVMKMPSIGP
mgnify:CR=1 FL=1